jgi:membrane protein required for beta-lactamase induction
MIDSWLERFEVWTEKQSKTVRAFAEAAFYTIGFFLLAGGVVLTTAFLLAFGFIAVVVVLAVCILCLGYLRVVEGVEAMNEYIDKENDDGSD